ncbi:hypothetical protein WMY93_001684 [Mugilogobius chulae]|uniref:Uncharacterized protein n=1 Tax=Mugilogobius chulae TaxID=88201 RepID=A0AAW0PRA6_9GOBI
MKKEPAEATAAARGPASVRRLRPPAQQTDAADARTTHRKCLCALRVHEPSAHARAGGTGTGSSRRHTPLTPGRQSSSARQSHHPDLILKHAVHGTTPLRLETFYAARLVRA